MSSRSWSTRFNFWFESWAESVGPISAIELNELWVPTQGAFRRPTSPPSSYWSPRARCSQDDW